VYELRVVVTEMRVLCERVISENSVRERDEISV
jgi:hypothetical protein